MATAGVADQALLPLLPDAFADEGDAAAVEAAAATSLATGDEDYDDDDYYY